jgi:hypothetical protein
VVIEISVMANSKEEEETQRRTTEVLLSFLHPISGDFNALQRSDYSDMEWNQIANVRSYSGWEPPLSELLETLTKKEVRKKQRKAQQVRK